MLGTEKLSLMGSWHTSISAVDIYIYIYSIHSVPNDSPVLH